ncbi:hypothetical protein [Micropruina sonneratiae]|uniref:hypothetical protein n=1 Tax=Micropruina sonneratiae TaxID=2986940 RepID=UPI0022273C27|nr:hypothetical protein [Micropruina sp. KQZ13P-5]MCW3158865.1 hypothetical protein [Micropruina sp. KQZ13P-5]
MTVMIGHRFRGPDTSGNGGYSAGAVAAALGSPCGPTEVTLLSPPPLDVALAVARDGDAITVSHGATTVATARPASLRMAVPEPPSFAQAERAASGCPWLVDHPYPQCFVCGTERPDGLHIFPGPVAGRRLAAAPWVPDATVCHDGVVRSEIVWASVDCPSLFGYGCFASWDGLMLLGRFTAQVHRAPDQGERCVLTGWSFGRDGRKYDTAAALHTADGELLALSRALWITLKK